MKSFGSQICEVKLKCCLFKAMHDQLRTEDRLIKLGINILCNKHFIKSKDRLEIICSSTTIIQLLSGKASN